MIEGHGLTSELSDSIKKAIRTALSSRHVPQFIIEGKSLSRERKRVQCPERIRQLALRHVESFGVEGYVVCTDDGVVPAIPTTINGKKVESAVKQTISGKDVKPSNTVANPEALYYFRRFRDIDREPRRTKL